MLPTIHQRTQVDDSDEHFAVLVLVPMVATAVDYYLDLYAVWYLVWILPRRYTSIVRMSAKILDLTAVFLCTW